MPVSSVTISHCGATAPVALWSAMGYRTGTPDHETWWLSDDQPGLNALVYAGRAATGADDWRAVAWAGAEKSRRDEAKTAATALARQAESISQLAESIRTSADKSMLDRILAGLSERTRYAVKQQLKGQFGM